MADKLLDGTSPRYDNSPNRKLSSEDVASIRRRRTAGAATGVELAAEYGVHESTISNIVTGRTWVLK